LRFFAGMVHFRFIGASSKEKAGKIAPMLIECPSEPPGALLRRFGELV
jgi:hypothetical protein